MNQHEFVEKYINDLRGELESAKDISKYYMYIHCDICPMRKKCDPRKTKMNCKETLWLNIDRVEE